MPAALHATVQGPPFWKGLFDEQGLALHHMLEDVAGEPPWWDYCTYIFQPATPRPRRPERRPSGTSTACCSSRRAETLPPQEVFAEFARGYLAARPRPSFFKKICGTKTFSDAYI